MAVLSGSGGASRPNLAGDAAAGSSTATHDT